jgi:histidinol dehydrogenase
MIRILEINREQAAAPLDALRRVAPSSGEVADVCRDIIAAVRRDGDAALLDCTRRFDGADLSELGLRVRPEEFAKADAAVEPALRAALAHAIRNIRVFHEGQMPPALAMAPVEPGVWCGDRVTPIDSVCLYVPRGRGAFSSVMCMLGVPAVVAKVPHIVVCTPPGPDGRVDAATLAAAGMVGVREIYRVGGAQAVAAVAYGTETVPRCAKIIGPGNVYVSGARHILSDVLDPGPPAGPSESAILCDEAANPENAGWNLLIEAEHGENSCAILVTHSTGLAKRIAAAAEAFLTRLSPQRREYARQVLEKNGGIIVTDSLETSIAVVNAYAPEHLAIMVARPWDVLESIRNAGEILIGDYPIISLGNYAMGLNAILPTGGQAVTRSCVSVHDFLKRSSVGYVSREGFDALRPVVTAMSRDEGFSAHHLAVENWNTGV